MNSVDLHFHLLPGVDDGPCDMEESLDLARAAVAEGTATVVTTPHVRSDYITDVQELRERVDELRAAIAAAGIDLAVLRGGELGHEMVGRLRQAELDSVAQGPPAARWLLVETPFGGIGADFHAATDELRGRGFGVLVAHPERSGDAALCGSAGLRRELAAGSLAQVNAMSLAGQHGEDVELAGLGLVREGLVSVVASDAHGRTRPPALTLARAAMLDRGLPAHVGRDLTRSAAGRLLARGIPPARALAA
jgi:protein-tyrosine phosphatase